MTPEYRRTMILSIAAFSFTRDLLERGLIDLGQPGLDDAMIDTLAQAEQVTDTRGWRTTAAAAIHAAEHSWLAADQPFRDDLARQCAANLQNGEGELNDAIAEPIDLGSYIDRAREAADRLTAHSRIVGHV